MRKRTSKIKALVSLIAFLLIEGLSLFLISGNGTIQEYKLMTAVRNSQSKIWDSSKDIRYYFSLKETNNLLEEENIRLVKEIERYRMISSRYISDSLIREYEPEFDYIPATVVKNTTTRQHNYIILNKGSEDGVASEMGVITPSGIVGYIQSVGKNHSLAVSFLDINSSMTAVIKKTGTFGTLEWGGNSSGEASLRGIPVHATFSIGDTITTSGFSAIYPKGIDLGVIKSSKNMDGTSIDLIIDLFQDYSNLHHVYIVDNPNNIEFKKLINEGEGLQ
jgi:rod shape-determining protein MreC